MATSLLDVSIRLYQALPMADPTPPKPTSQPAKEPLDPTSNVNVNSVFGHKINDMLGWVQIGAWTLVLVSLIGCGGMMAWSWITGKGFQAMGRVGWVVGGSIVIASATQIIGAFN